VIPHFTIQHSTNHFSHGQRQQSSQRAGDGAGICEAATTGATGSKTRENLGPCDLDILPSHIEILQALYLQIKANDLSYEPFRLEILEKIHNYVKQLSRAYSLRQLDSDSINLSDDKKAVKFIQRLMRDTTRVVRNWGHFSQVKRIVRELYSQFDAKLLEIRGFSVSDVINVFDIILSTAESRITTHRNTLADLFRTSGTDRQLLVKNYHSLIGSDKKETDRWIQQFNVKNFSLDDIYFIIISNYIYLRSSDVFTFSSFNLAQSLDLTEDQVIAILDEYALGWEALSEYDIEDFHLSNPVWMKPIIKLDDRKYFCALPVGFFSFAVPCIESLLSSFKDAVSERRAEYLEAKVTEIVKTRFPDSKIKRNFKWMDADIIYETDLIVFIDSFALIIECKSGKVTPPALRGAPDRLRRRIQKLLIDPNIQSLRLKNALNSSVPIQAKRILSVMRLVMI